MSILKTKEVFELQYRSFWESRGGFKSSRTDQHRAVTRTSRGTRATVFGARTATPRVMIAA